MTSETRNSTASRLPSPGVREKSFPLISLMQLATCWAALFMCVDFDSTRQQGRGPAGVENIVPLPIFGAVIGGVIGAGQLQFRRGLFVGIAIGFFSGVVITLVYIAPAPAVRAAFASVIVLLTTMALRIRAV